MTAAFAYLEGRSSIKGVQSVCRNPGSFALPTTLGLMLLYFVIKLETEREGEGDTR